MSKLSDALAALDKESPSVEDFGIMDEATVPALAWIKEALPWLEAYQKFLQDEGVDNEHHLSALDALIAQAKPEEVGR